MRRPIVWIVVAATAAATTVAVVAARSQEPPKAEAALAAEPVTEKRATARIVRVDSVNVCMVNDRDMQAAQIPVDVDGKRYYGCCPMCKERLAKEVAARTSTDPVSGKPVDKSKAIIGRLADGSVRYFEGENTFARYARGEGR